MSEYNVLIKPKFKFKICKKCDRKRKYLNEFGECKSCEKCMKCVRCNQTRRDYLSELLVCSPCYEQLEQRTPNGFKPNFEFERCKRCNIQPDYLNEFVICNLCHQQMKQMTPDGFKPNFELKRCKSCNIQQDYLNEFNE